VRAPLIVNFGESRLCQVRFPDNGHIYRGNERTLL